MQEVPARNRGGRFAGRIRQRTNPGEGIAYVTMREALLGKQARQRTQKIIDLRGGWLCLMGLPFVGDFRCSHQHLVVPRDYEEWPMVCGFSVDGRARHPGKCGEHNVAATHSAYEPFAHTQRKPLPEEIAP